MEIDKLREKGLIIETFQAIYRNFYPKFND